MVRKKDTSIRQDFLDMSIALRRELEQNTIKTEFYVIENTPGYNTGGYYDSDIPDKNVRVSPFFDTRLAADDWLSMHEPDEGKELRINRRRLVRRTYTEWINY